MKIKDLLVVYLHQRIIIFPLHLCINQIVNEIFKKIDDWNLLREKKLISGKEKYFKFFLEKEILDILNSFDIFLKKLNVKIITVYKDNCKIKLDFAPFIKDEKKIIKSIVKGFAKNTKHFFDKVPDKITFEQTNFSYKDLKVGCQNGETEEFLFLLNKKLRNL